MPTSRPATWQDIITAEARAARVPPALALAVADTESAFNPQAKSPTGAIGLMQLMPATAKDLGVDPNDPMQNIQGGVKYLRQMLDQHHGDVSLALAAYNAGPGAVAAAGGIPKIPETEQYVQRVTGKLPIYHSQTGPTLAQGGRGAPPPTRSGPPPPPQTEDSLLWKYTKELASNFDPRERSGRRNLAGAAGATAAAVLSGGASVPIQIGAAMLGAGALGAGAEGAEQVAHGEDLDVGKIAGAGAQQAAYEGVGQVGGWAVRAGGNRLLASKVAKNAVEGLEKLRVSKTAALDSALSQAEDVLRTTRRGTADQLRATRSATRAHTAEAVTKGAEAVEDAKAVAAMREQRALQQGQAAIGAPPTPAAAGRSARAIVEGPGQTYKSQVGALVEQTAEHGPELDLTPVRQKAQEIFDNQIKDVASYFTPGGTEAEEAAKQQALALLGSMEKRGASEADKLAFLNTLREAGVPLGVAEATWETARHPAMGTIQKILHGEPIVPFRAAHQLKRLLDEGVNWESPAKKQMQQVTKGLRQSLRTVMGTHEPYNEATAAYQHLSTLFGNKTLIGQFRKAAETDPESLVRLISPSSPTKVGLLREVLVDVSDKGGATEGGQRAWDAVRAAWTSKNVLKGGIEKLGPALEKLEAQSPEFVREFYGDESGQTILKNLKQISTAYQKAVEDGRLLVESTEKATSERTTLVKAAGEGKIRQVAEQGRTAVRSAQDAATAAKRARQAAKAATPEEERLGKSSLAKFEHTDPEHVVADVARAALMSPSFAGKYTSFGHLIRGPRSKDMIEWAAYSGKGTQILVKILNSAKPGVGLAYLGQMFGGAVMGSPEQTSGAPPKPTSQPGAPPVPTSLAAGR